MDDRTNRFKELAQRAGMRGIYIFSDFHSPSGIAEAYNVCHRSEIKVWGGADFCERAMIRFGNESEIGYEEDFPIALIAMEPRVQKFADNLTHRDFLGALMNLGIERDMIGDIIVSDNTGYVFVVSRMADLIIESITSVKRTSVKCSLISDLPDHARPQIRRQSLNISSERADAVIARTFNLARSAAKDLFAEDKVFVNGQTSRGAGASLSEGDVVSVRGYGKLIFYGISGETRKGRLVADVGIYS